MSCGSWENRCSVARCDTGPTMARKMLGVMAMWLRRRPGAVTSGGYTLLELVTVMALIAIAAALAYPGLREFRGGQELEGAAVTLLHTMRLAHWRAVVSGRRVRLTARREEDLGWRYRLEREEAGGWVPEGEERSLPRNTLLGVAGPAAKVFNPDGTCSFGSLSLRGCGGGGYRFTLAPATGRVRFYRGEREAGRE